jgi:hypothetical protein
MQRSLQVLEESLELPPVILVWILDPSGQKSRDGLNVASGLGTEEEELRHRVVKCGSLFYRQQARFLLVPHLKQVVGRRGRLGCRDFFREVSDDGLDVFIHIYDHVTVHCEVQYHA